MEHSFFARMNSDAFNCDSFSNGSLEKHDLILIAKNSRDKVICPIKITMKSVLIVLFLLLLPPLFLGSCASKDLEAIDNSNPMGDIGEGFMTQEPRTYREDKYRPNEFFFKQCEQNFGSSHYSKTAYFCNER